MATTVKQQQTRSQRIKERASRRRAELWPDIPTAMNWNRKGSDGFSTIPRTLTLIGTIADSLAEKNKRVSTSYFGLWCRVWDTGVVVIENEYELATEAGFTGERRIYTWRDRIKQLERLDFVKVKSGPKGPYQYILIMNPYYVLYTHNTSGKIQSEYWLCLVERAEEIGAKDLATFAKSLETGTENSKKSPNKKRKPRIKN